MTTIPYTSFETNTAQWAKGHIYSLDYQKLATEVSVDSSDLIIKFTNLPANIKVANSPVVNPYNSENEAVILNIYIPDIDMTFVLIGTYFSEINEWQCDVEAGMTIRDSNNTALSSNQDFTFGGNQIIIIESDGEILVVGNSSFTYLGDSYELDILEKLTADDIREIGNPNTTFENLGSSSYITAIGAHYIPHAYTKINDTTISVPRNVEIKNVYLPTNRLYVNFTR